ncbi:hypothetical protein [Pseudonocardia acidicola]|uniref:Uncharacterized protein n=1 Tax=Pseudonocardia acidicola TaxID=2724939 RepID=A0ABX1SI07_9PSEU|nr:hypothetical protein [Pseudonocardia acidicola]NMI00473.1 hypothetical protein [Pseudonocardia acidicola]
MPPITIVFVITGLAVLVNACAFLGIGSEPKGDGPSPLVTVGWITLAAGIVDLIEAVYILAVRPSPRPSATRRRFRSPVWSRSTGRSSWPWACP